MYVLYVCICVYIYEIRHPCFFGLNWFVGIPPALGGVLQAFLLCYACRVLHGWHQQTTHWVNFVQVQGMLDPKVYPDLTQGTVCGYLSGCVCRNSRLQKKNTILHNRTYFASFKKKKKRKLKKKRPRKASETVVLCSYKSFWKLFPFWSVLCTLLCSCNCDTQERNFRSVIIQGGVPTPSWGGNVVWACGPRCFTLFGGSPPPTWLHRKPK